MKLYHGDCLEVMRTLEAGSADAVVTDPPAGIAFMGKSWDKDKGGRNNWIAWMESVALECLRLIRPGGHALVWALPRTSHWTAMAWESAGWEVRDRIAFAFGSGFPKALDVGKAIDAMAGETPSHDGYLPNGKKACYGAGFGGGTKTAITAPATEAAKQWGGWKSALKPAIEDWWLFRKPLDGTIVENVLKHGVGALNVEACRVPSKESTGWGGGGSRMYEGGLSREGGEARLTDAGRYPSHLIHDGSEDVVMCFPETTSGIPGIRRKEHETTSMSGKLGITGKQECGIGDSGSASRFFQCCPFEDEDFEATRLFYAAKAGKSDRNEGCE
ncbi:MAG: site-specific DNA-methyltransferase, partial [Synergistales bacterium]|nr:site-specific DNA-methyltransferase [Synergistales bacterium]